MGSKINTMPPMTNNFPSSLTDLFLFFTDLKTTIAPVMLIKKLTTRRIQICRLVKSGLVSLLKRKTGRIIELKVPIMIIIVPIFIPFVITVLLSFWVRFWVQQRFQTIDEIASEKSLLDYFSNIVNDLIRATKKQSKV